MGSTTTGGPALCRSKEIQCTLSSGLLNQGPVSMGVPVDRQWPAERHSAGLKLFIVILFFWVSLCFNLSSRLLNRWPVSIGSDGGNHAGNWQIRKLPVSYNPNFLLKTLFIFISSGKMPVSHHMSAGGQCAGNQQPLAML